MHKFIYRWGPASPAQSGLNKGSAVGGGGAAGGSVADPTLDWADGQGLCQPRGGAAGGGLVRGRGPRKLAGCPHP